MKIGIVAALAALALAGCQGKEQAAPTDGATAKKIKLAFVTNNASDFWTIARKGTEKAAQEMPDVQIEFKIPSDGTAAEQKRILDDLLASGVDGIAISPVSPADQTEMLDAAAAKTKLVTQDSDAPDSARICYIGTDNVEAGRQAGELVKEALPGGGKVMLFVGMKDAQNAKERIQGVREALEGSNITVVDVRTDDTDRVRAKANVADTLVSHPDIACLVGLWSYNGPAILNAVREAGKAGKVKIVCFDEEDETLAGVKSGDIEGTIVQQPYEFGYQSMRLLARLNRGEKDLIPEDKKMIVPTLVVRKNGVEEFQKKLNELRGR
jgi:ribose transport system substrate-binding protein